MEHFSSFDRVIGNIPEQEKEQILLNKGECFNNQAFEELKGKEREKTSEELEVISIVNEATNEVRQRYDLDDFDIPSNNIHVIAEEQWWGEKFDAIYRSDLQGVAMREQPSLVAFAVKTFHEMLHFKSYNALQITKGENPKMKVYRVGLRLRTRDGNESYFRNLNEAVTEKMTKKYMKKVFDNPIFSSEITQTKSIVAKYSKVQNKLGKPLFNKDTYYAVTESKKSWKEAVGRLFGVEEKLKKIMTQRFTYRKERDMLNTLIGKIFERNKDKFQDKEGIFDVFEKSMMTGNMLLLGRLIENTFGPNTLRRIGELDKDMEVQESFINSL